MRGVGLPLSGGFKQTPGQDLRHLGGGWGGSDLNKDTQHIPRCGRLLRRMWLWGVQPKKDAPPCRDAADFWIWLHPAEGRTRRIWGDIFAGWNARCR